MVFLAQNPSITFPRQQGKKRLVATENRGLLLLQYTTVSANFGGKNTSMERGLLGLKKHAN